MLFMFCMLAVYDDGDDGNDGGSDGDDVRFVEK